MDSSLPSSTASHNSSTLALSSAELCGTWAQCWFLSPAGSFLVPAFFVSVKDTAGNERTSRTAAGVGVSAVGVGCSMVEGKGLCG
jgi:hypothetical protein